MRPCSLFEFIVDPKISARSRADRRSAYDQSRATGKKKNHKKTDDETISIAFHISSSRAFELTFFNHIVEGIATLLWTGATI